MATGVDARLLKSTKFPSEFSQKVDMQKVNLQVMKKLLLSAQASPQGVPKELLEAKKLELIQEKIEADRAAESAKKRRDDWDRRDRELMGIPGKGDEATANSILEEEEASGEEVLGLGLQGPVSATRGIPMVETVTSLVGDEAAVELDLVDQGPLLDRLQHLAHLDRTRAAVVRRAAPTDLTVGDDPHRPIDGETGERDHDRPEATPTEAGQTVEMMEDVELLHLALYPPSDVLLRRSEDDTLLQEADR
ncbi:hypothetical protein N0V84_003465 [Fusarium piperis]|uniref:Uncharacterized protein n=1 Tax=Fusarium piperis TaxID=1435070 RepID=A0A9W8WHC6_9HYPO|nr:hypothetical protein N0V84_003465 [Fusarium piperis]